MVKSVVIVAAKSRGARKAKPIRRVARRTIAPSSVTSATSASVPDAARALSRKLSTYPGVVGVFFGTGRKRRRWNRRQVISVHVRWKRPAEDLPPAECIPKELDGYLIDVLEVGHPSVDALDHADVVFGDASRSSTLTALASGEGCTLGLLSGHGTLPLKNGRIMRVFERSNQPVRIEIRDEIGVVHGGQLLRGRIGNGSALDFAVARFDASIVSNSFHLAVGNRPPFLLCTTPLTSGEPVFHYSSVRKRRMRGLFRQVSTTLVELRLPDAQRTQYAEVLVVGNDGATPFSIAGDSGSLVVDAQGRVVGAVLGSSVTARIAYVLDVEALETIVPDAFTLIFRR